MDIVQLRDQILLATLPHVDFDGWTMDALKAGNRDLGNDDSMVMRAFPGGLRDFTSHWADYMDRQMTAALEKRDLASMRIRDRIACCVRTRLDLMAPYREAVRRAVSYFALPTNADIAARATWNAVGAMWYAAGDRSADFNYYTKRMMLTPVYTSTLLCWLQDESEDFADTWAFLDRRIENVMQFQKAKGKVQDNLEKCLKSMPHPFRAFKEGIKNAGAFRQ